MAKKNAQPAELNNGTELPTVGTVEPQASGEGVRPSEDLTEGNDAVEVPVEPQKVICDVVYASKYRVNYRYGLNLRAGPGREHPVIRVLPKGTVILVEDGSVAVGSAVWYPTGEGWVDSAYLVPVEEG